MKPLVRLIHWHAAEARAHARQLAKLGYVVEAGLPPAPALLRDLRQHPDAVILISLDRLPSQGRNVAFIVRGQPSTRAVPLVFVGGAAEKVAAVRAKLPDGFFTSWKEIGPVLARVLTDPAAIPPAAPAGAMAGYSGTPLPAKLGIKPDMTVTVLGGPSDFAAVIGALPSGARLTSRVSQETRLALWFVPTRRAFARGLGRAIELGERMPVWVISPKKTGPLAADLSQNDIRASCLAGGLVDYKVCAVDVAWTGLLFRRRRKPSDKSPR
jgi:hypothetical protein